ncbi:hypothetical protein [Bacteriophage sp.]|nr:hypothetical protein [Bacteriophage sp.]
MLFLLGDKTMPSGIRSANPRKPKPSDVTAKYRKRLKRRIAHIEKTMDSVSSTRKNALEQQVTNLNSMLRETYQPMTKDEKAELFRQIEKTTPARNANREKRLNRVFMRQIKLGVTGEDSTLANNTMEAQIRTKVFWQATKMLWLGGSRKDREKAILKGYGVDTLEEAYRITQENNEELIQQMINEANASAKGNINNSDDMTAEADEAYKSYGYLLAMVK